MHEYKYAINVKSRTYNRAILDEAHDILGEQTVETVWNSCAYCFWDDAATLAREHGYADVEQAGRSGGWLVPLYRSSERSPSRTFFTVSQWLEDCWEHEVAEHEARFERFKEAVEELQREWEAEFEAELAARTAGELARREALLELGKGTQ